MHQISLSSHTYITLSLHIKTAIKSKINNFLTLIKTAGEGSLPLVQHIDYIKSLNLHLHSN